MESTECKTDVVAEIRCIVCPTGCLVQVKKDEQGNINFEGYTCKRGLEYAKQEYFEPKRIITTTMRVENGFLPLIPVRSEHPILKNRINDALLEIAKQKVTAPISIGDILIENILNLGVNIIASRNLASKPK